MSKHDAASWGFLGEEFLTWLWFRIDTRGGDFELPGNRHVAVVIDDFLAFAPREQDQTEQTLRKGLPTHSAEAAAALRNGCRLRKAKLLLAHGQAQWSLVVDGQTMNLLSVRLPEQSDEVNDAREASVERAMHFVAVHELVAGLYRSFLDERLAPEYLRTSAEAQAQWMASR